MPYVIDGSNLLGGERDATDAKRLLVRELGRFARARRTKVICFFDGPEPEAFAKQMGAVSVVFSGRVPADELIVKRVGNGDGWKVVTRDRGIAARVGGRRVEIVEPQSFTAELARIPPDASGGDDVDWMSYFSDPKNRNVF